jgi:hypothetical protein
MLIITRHEKKIVKIPLYGKNSDLFIYYNNGIFPGLCTRLPTIMLYNTSYKKSAKL